MSVSNEKGNPAPAPQCPPYDERFPSAAHPEGPAVAATDDKDVPPAPQGAPAAGFAPANTKG